MRNGEDVKPHNTLVKEPSMMARPEKEIDKKTFEGLCNLQCTEEEICGFLNVTDKTLVKWCKKTYGLGFSDTFKKYSQGGKVSLRRSQFRMAETNSTMAIWLGKQYLGQRDNPEESLDQEDTESYFKEAGLNDF